MLRQISHRSPRDRSRAGPDEGIASRAEARLGTSPPCFHGHSSAARHVIAQLQRAIRLQVPALLVGPTGAGRETIARIIHHFAGGETATMDVVRPRPGRRLVGLGAFTYLADLEDLSIEEQVRLPMLVGAGRLVAATRLDLEHPEAQRRLHPRILRWVCGVRIDVPALCDRMEDLELLAMGILRETPTRCPVGGIADEALEHMRVYRWPGQIDELREVITSAGQVATTGRIELRDLPSRLRIRDANQGPRKGKLSEDRRLQMVAVQKQAILRALGYARGNRRKAAVLLGISKTTLYRKMREYGLAASSAPAESAPAASPASTDSVE